METTDPISHALALLDGPAENSAYPPAMVVLPPDSGNFILGNRDGFICLAVAALKAAQGEEQSFKGKPWVKIEDLDWGVRGLKLDPNAHIYLPTKRTRFQKAWRNVLGLLVVLLIVVCALIGFATVVIGLFRHV